MNLIAIRPTNRNRDRLPNFASLQPKQLVKSLRCRWILSGDTSLTVVCTWHFDADDGEEALTGDIPIEMSRCA